jgi:hypothetical protein
MLLFQYAKVLYIFLGSLFRHLVIKTALSLQSYLLKTWESSNLLEAMELGEFEKNEILDRLNNIKQQHKTYPLGR